MAEQAPTVYSIAQELNLSPATVSRVVNHPEQVKAETRLKVEARLRETGFQKRRYVSGQENVLKREAPENRRLLEASRQFPDVLVNIPGLLTSFYLDIIEGIRTALDRQGFHLIADFTPVNEQSIDRLLDYSLKHCQGLILLSHTNDAILRKLSQNIPVVQCSECNPNMKNIFSVGIDDYSAELNAAQYLIKSGRKKIAFMTVDQPFYFARQRYLGYRFAMESADLHISPEYLIQVPRFEHSLAYEAAVRFFESGVRPEAVLCTSDVYAAACIKAAGAFGIRVPEELAVIGFDNISLAEIFSPSITTVAQPRFRLGYSAAQSLAQLIRDRTLQRRHIVLPTELVLRESTGTIISHPGPVIDMNAGDRIRT